MIVFIKTLTIGTFPVEIEPTNTVHKLKGRIYDKIGTPVDIQCLLLGGAEIKDDHKLMNYDIKNETTLQLILKLGRGINNGVEPF